MTSPQTKTLFIVLIVLLGQITLQQRSDLEWESAEGCGKGCEICNPYTDTCSQCGPQQYYSNSTQTCRGGSISNCRYYTSSRTCRECEPGYRLSNGQCQACTVPNCASCPSSNSTCAQCLDRFSSTSQITRNCQVNCNVENCKTCADINPTNCVECQPGFRVSSDRSTCRSCQVANCSRCSEDLQRCERDPASNVSKACLPNFFLNNSICVGCQNGCLECSFNGLCERCNTTSNFYMYQNMECQFQPLIPLIHVTIVLLISIFAN